jgi:hypothetical protein
MKRIILSLLLTLTSSFAVFAGGGEGMWLPHLLQQLNEAEMRSLGMKMSIEDIYSVNKGSLKDAIVRFGGGCTGEIISSQGLLLTNHHCGYGQIQRHTTLDNNYLEEGFWAGSREEELPNPGLTAMFIDRIEDVTSAILGNISKDATSEEREAQINRNIEAFRANVKIKDYEEVMIRPFFHGNQYIMFVTVTYRDVRLVGAPPSSIGKFGADTDNWEWPRHTGDFSLFRVYADGNNLPADYSPDNQPLEPKHFLPISLDGVEEGDFTMIFGFPGRTNEYLPAVAVEQIVDVLNPAKIGIRDRALKIMDQAMRADKQVKIQYASKFASIANYWKKWIGESEGLKLTKGIEKKRDLEKAFMTRINKSKGEWKDKYGNLLSDFDALYAEIAPYSLSLDYYSEVFGRNVELFRIAGYMDRLVKAYENNGQAGYDDFKGRLSSYLDGFYKNYNAGIDQKVFMALVELFVDGVPLKEGSEPVRAFMLKRSVPDYLSTAGLIYENSAFISPEAVEALFALPAEEAVAKIKEDMAYEFGMGLKEVFDEKITAEYQRLDAQIREKQRIYMKALMDVFPNKRFYPDANSTMRITYGQVEGYQPMEGDRHHHSTYLSGVIEKYVPGDYEFDVPQKLIELYQKKDYGQYATEDGKMPVCFLGSNHTTGGNSGSPAIDAYGNLIGLNFDRVWEGTMSDYNYDRSICRNIMVDARYVLFIIDKYAGAGHLINEMKLVNPKKNPPKMKEDIKKQQGPNRSRIRARMGADKMSNKKMIKKAKE